MHRQQVAISNMKRTQKGGNFRGKKHQRSKKQEGGFLPLLLGKVLGLGGGGRRAPPPQRRLPPQPWYHRPPPRYRYGPPPPPYRGRIQKRYRQRGGFLTDSINTGVLDHYGEHKHSTEKPKKQKGGFSRALKERRKWHRH